MKKKIARGIGFFLLATAFAPVFFAHAQATDFIEFDGLTVTGAASSIAPGSFAASQSLSTSCHNYPSIDAATSILIACPTDSAAGVNALVTPSTQILLENYVRGTLGNIAAGNIVNVLGQYLDNGTLQAYSIRDLSEAGSVGTVAPVPPTTIVTSSETTASNAALLVQLEILLGQMQSLTNQINSFSSSTSGSF